MVLEQRNAQGFGIRIGVLGLALILASSVNGSVLAQDPAQRGGLLSDLTLEQKAAQMVFPRLPGTLLSDDHEAFAEVADLVRDGLVGGVILFGGDPLSAKATADRLQALSPIPLLVGLDAEWGIGMRFEGGTRFPVAMAVGAGNDAELAESIGRVTAKEALALGIHLILAPVLDLGVEPDNKVIGTRAFGSDPIAVGMLGSAFVRGVQSAGALAVAKHFPGHGGTIEDSHFALPRLTIDLDTLMRRELVPFAHSVQAGVAGVMPAHLVVEAVDDQQPASRSPAVLQGLLRRDLGFDGLIVSDALDMEGASGDWHGSVVEDTVKAGTDVLLLPPYPRVALNALVRAVRRGEISEARLDQSVEKILAAKRRVGLFDRRDPNNGDTAPLTSDRSQAAALARRVAEAAVVWVEEPVAELSRPTGIPGDCLGGQKGSGACWAGKVTVVSLLDEFDRQTVPRTVARQLARRATAVSDYWVRPSSVRDRDSQIRTSIEGADAVLIASYASRESWGPLTDSAAGVSVDESVWRQVEQWIDLARTAGKPVVFAALNDPWTLAIEAPSRIGVFDSYVDAQAALIRALYGEIPIGGVLPVEVARSGVALSSRDFSSAPWRFGPSTLPVADLAGVGMKEDLRPRLRKILEQSIREGAFPGATAVVLRHGQVVFAEAVGNLTYESESPAVDLDVVYDVASLTKVIVTTTLSMILEERGVLDLSAPVIRYLPEFASETEEAKSRVTVLDLLTHSSGILWWTDLYQRHAVRGVPSLAAREGYLAEITSMPLNSTPRSSTEYSDLGIFLLGEVLQRVTGRSLDDLARMEIFEPLSMMNTGYRPTELPLELGLERIAPTEVDSSWRNELVWGEVHDENAAGLGGVAPHAGVFSTAPDLARFLQMLMNGGHLNGQRLLKSTTIDRYTQRVGLVPGSSRAIGWDTPSGKSSAGDYVSSSAFGHTGFTGTSLWVDLERDVAMVLLTNRVHPTRENRQISGVRRAFHDAVLLAIEDVPVAKRLSEE